MYGGNSTALEKPKRGFLKIFYDCKNTYGINSVDSDIRHKSL